MKQKNIFPVFVISAIFCMAWGIEAQITKAMKRFKIIPDIVSGSVPELLEIIYDDRLSVNMGNEISPSQARNEPAVNWDADKNSFYTLICFDPHAPSPDDPSISHLVTWLVGNIPGNDIDSGDVLTAYIPVSPPKGRKNHQSVFLLFKQPKRFVFDEKVIDDRTFAGRTKFPLVEFCKKYGLGNPTAGNFYLTKFDPYVTYIYKKLNCCFKYNKEDL